VYCPDGIGIEAIQNKLCYDKHYVKKPTMGLLSEIGRMYCNRDGSFSVEVDNDVISQALVNHMKRRDDADRCSDLYTIEASNTLKTGHPSSAGFTVASDGSDSNPASDRSHTRSDSLDSESDRSDTSSPTTFDWDPMTAKSF
jgi:hypothetical protein